MLRVRGDFKKLSALVRDLNNPDAILNASARAARDELIRKIKRGYATQRDPYGQPWTKKLAKDGRKTLTGPSRDLREGWKATRVDKDGVELTAERKAIFHQEPIKRRRRKDGESLVRMQVPDESRGLPQEWARDLGKAIADVIGKKIGS
jgi:hypothetical protein